MSSIEYTAESANQVALYNNAEPDNQLVLYNAAEPDHQLVLHDTIDPNYPVIWFGDDDDSADRAAYSCDRPGHFHAWPTTGELEIERCEHYCLYCRGAKAQKKWSSAWFLRRHVRETHAKTEYPGLTVSEGWSKRPQGNTRPMFKKQRAPGSNKKRAGTKKDRAALMKVFNQAKQSAGYSSHSYEQFPLPVPSTMPAPTAVMNNCPPGYMPAQAMPSTAWSANSTLALPATQSPPSSKVSVDAPATVASLALIEGAYQAGNALDMISTQSETDKFEDSALGTSIASSDVYDTPQLSQDEISTISNDDLALSQMLAAYIAQEDAKAKPSESYFQEDSQDDFATLFAGSHFDTFNSDMDFADFSLDPAFNFDNTPTTT